MAEVTKTSEDVKEGIKLKSACSLPDNPSSVGYTPDEIRKALYTPITGNGDIENDRYSIQAELDRIVVETNDALSETLKEAKIYADTVASTAEKNAKSYADAAASTAEKNAQSYVDGKLGDIGAAIDELKDYANGLIGGAG